MNRKIFCAALACACAVLPVCAWAMGNTRSVEDTGQQETVSPDTGNQNDGGCGTGSPSGDTNTTPSQDPDDTRAGAR